MIKTEFEFNDHFQEMICSLGFSKAVVLKFINDNTNNGKDLLEMSIKDIGYYLFYISDSLISRSLRELEQGNLIKSVIKNKSDFNRVKSYCLDKNSLFYLSKKTKFSYNELGEEKTILGYDYISLDDYINNVKYGGMNESEYILYLIKYYNNLPY